MVLLQLSGFRGWRAKVLCTLDWGWKACAKIQWSTWRSICLSLLCVGLFVLACYGGSGHMYCQTKCVSIGSSEVDGNHHVSELCRLLNYSHCSRNCCFLWTGDAIWGNANFNLNAVLYLKWYMFLPSDLAVDMGIWWGVCFQCICQLEGCPHQKHGKLMMWWYALFEPLCSAVIKCARMWHTKKKKYVICICDCSNSSEILLNATYI